MKVSVIITSDKIKSTFLIETSLGINLSVDQLQVSSFHVPFRLEHSTHDLTANVDISEGDLTAIITRSVCVWLRTCCITRSYSHQ